MNKDQQIAAIQRDVDEAKSTRDLAQSLSRLERNKDFQKVIATAYFKDEAVRLVHLRAEPDTNLASIDKQLDSIANLTVYLRTVRQLGELAEKAIRDGESTIEQLHTED